MEWAESDEKVLFNASQKMQSNGFGAFKPKGKFLVSSAVEENSNIAHIGQVRVSFQYDRCAEATIVAQ